MTIEDLKRAFDKMLKRCEGSARKKAWTERRVNQFFDVLGCGWKFREVGYWSMKSYLAHTFGCIGLIKK